MMTLSELIAAPVRMVHGLQKRLQLYNDAELMLTVVGRAGENPVFRDAVEAGDVIAVIDVVDWLAVFPGVAPARFDKVVIVGTDGGTAARITETGDPRITEDGDLRILGATAAAGTGYTVQNWHGSPPDGVPILYRLLLRGGSI